MASIGPVNVKVGMDSSEFRAGARKMNVGIKNIEKEVGGVKRSMASWRRDAKRIYRETRTPLERYQAGVAKLNTIYKQGHFGATTYRRGLAQLRAELNATGPAAMRTGHAFDKLAFALRAYVGIWSVQKVVGSSEGFAQAMSSSLAIVGRVSDETRKKMEAVAHTAAYDVKFAAEEAAKGYYYLFSAGMDVKQSMAALPSVAKFAQAGMFELARATELATDAQSAMGMKSKDPQQNLKNLTRVMDALVGGNTLADATTEEFAEALAKSGASLRVLNKDVEEGVALLAAFAEQGFKGADGAQQLNITLRNLQLKAIENEKAFERHGIAVYDDAGKMRVTAEIIKDLERKYTGLTDKQRVQMLMELGFTQKSIKSMQVLIGYGAEIEHWTKQLKAKAGVMEDVSNRQLPALTKGWGKFKDAMTELNIKATTSALAELGTTLEKIADLLSGRGLFAGTGGLTERLVFTAAHLDVFGTAYMLWQGRQPKKGMAGEGRQARKDRINAFEAGRDLGEGFTEGFESAIEDAKNIRNPLEDLLAQYTKTAERMGMDKEQLGGMAIIDAWEEFRKLRAEHGGALEEFDPIGASRQLDFLNTQIAQKEKALDLERQGKALMEQYATPKEKFGARLKDVASLLAAGAIDKRTAMMEMQAFGAGLGLGDTQVPTAMIRGTQAEYNQRIAMDQANPMTKLLKVAEAELLQSEEQVELSKETVALLERFNEVQTVSAPP